MITSNQFRLITIDLNIPVTLDVCLAVRIDRKVNITLYIYKVGSRYDLIVITDYPCMFISIVIDFIEGTGSMILMDTRRVLRIIVLLDVATLRFKNMVMWIRCAVTYRSALSLIGSSRFVPLTCIYICVDTVDCT